MCPPVVRSERAGRLPGGVLTLRIPVAEQAKPRKIEISTGADDGRAIDV
jgi:hypothetical protein